jgi:hypothetical protein
VSAATVDLLSLPEGAVLMVPGVCGLLALPAVEPEGDEVAVLCARISRPERGPFRVRISVEGVRR